MMVDVQHDELAPEAPENVQERDGIGAPRDRYTHAAPCRQHVITRDDFGNPLWQCARQYRHCKCLMQPNSPVTEEELHRLAANIKILLMDVDGVLTDGRLYLIP